MDVCVVVGFEDAARSRFAMVRHRTRGWELPGGRIEAGESPLEAARREFAEETGRRLLAAAPVLERAHPRGRSYLIAGLCGDVVAAPAPDEAASEVRFVSYLDDVWPLAFPEDDYDTPSRLLARPLLRPKRSDMSQDKPEP